MLGKIRSWGRSGLDVSYKEVATFRVLETKRENENWKPYEDTLDVSLQAPVIGLGSFEIPLGNLPMQIEGPESEFASGELVSGVIEYDGSGVFEEGGRFKLRCAFGVQEVYLAIDPASLKILV